MAARALLTLAALNLLFLTTEAAFNVFGVIFGW